MLHDTLQDPSKLTRASRVSNEIRDAIIAGKMRPGAKVNLDQLREEYGVSLSPIREAISRLVSDRLVEFEDKKGFRIVPLGMANLLEITRLRADLEALALKHAIAIGTLEWESKIPAAIHHTNNTTGTNQTAAHDLFHASLICGCAMPMLRDLCVMLGNLHKRYANILNYDGAGRDMAGEHAAIADAALARDAELGPTLLARHIERTGNDLSALFEKRAKDFK